MPRLISFTQVSLDGYFADSKSDMSWAHRQDPEFQEFVEGNAKGGGILLFGRVTYDLMKSYWPTPMAQKNDPVVADKMNSQSKLVFSRTMENATWSNTQVVGGDIIEQMKARKESTGEDMVILGSGSIVTQFAQARLIDEYQLIVNPILLGSGKKLFDGLSEKLKLKLVKSRAFGNGTVLLCYSNE